MQAHVAMVAELRDSPKFSSNKQLFEGFNNADGPLPNLRVWKRNAHP